MFESIVLQYMEPILRQICFVTEIPVVWNLLQSVGLDYQQGSMQNIYVLSFSFKALSQNLNDFFCCLEYEHYVWLFVYGMHFVCHHNAGNLAEE